MRSDIACEPDGLIKVFSEDETSQIEKKWMDVFCKNKQGLNTKSYKWHIFSGDGYPSVKENDAMKEYESRSAVNYVIMGNGNELAILTREKPVKCNLLDYYVFPVNMEWTMAFTHEQGWLGPYFAYHPNHKILQIENKKAREKERQKNIAKQKGWS